jgi:phospholipid/cholesterol/gamma-HCH transport system substrate-binding protein
VTARLLADHGFARLLTRPATVVAGVLVALLAALVAFVPGMPGVDAVAFWRHPTTTVTAHFTRAVGLYPGSQVRVLGVPVGTVRSVTPEGATVRVVLDVDADQKVPADAKAAVMSPSLVSDRYVQLLPAWTGGPVMADGGRIPVDRTAVPIELDRVTQSLDDLAVGLGPDGANADGSLSRMLDTAARNLDGQGDDINAAVTQLSQAVGTLSGGRDDLFGTVRNLQSFTSTLAVNDDQVRQLNSRLASVADQLSGERDDLAQTLANLAIALDEVSTFVHDNRDVLTHDVSALADVTGTIASKRDALAETLDNAPVALSNLQNAYNPASGTLDTRDNAEQLKNPELLICGMLGDQLGRSSTCADVIGKLLDPVLTLIGAVTSGHALPGAPVTSGGPATGQPGGIADLLRPPGSSTGGGLR